MITICKTEIDEKHINENFLFNTDSMRFRDEELYACSRNFLKNLGLKGDYVGWCELKKLSPDFLKELFLKAKEEKLRVRGIYKLTLTPEFESEWYELEGVPVPRSLDIDERENYTHEGKTYYLSSIRAFAMPKNVAATTRTLCDFACFREDTVNALQENGFSGAEFIWIPDIGKFKAPHQYYSAFPKTLLPYCYENIYDCLDYDIKSADFKNLSESAYIIAKNCNALTLDLPLAVERKLLPDCDFAGIYSPLTQHHRLLVRKNCRDFLIKKGFLKPEHFESVIVIEDSVSENNAKPLLLIKSGNFKPIPQKIKNEIEEKYKKHLKKEKPLRVASEKLALQSLRLAKKDNAEYFGKRASVKLLQNVTDERLIPYYKVANGGVISDEYTFYSIEETAKETAEFHKIQALENTDIIPQNAVVFGTAADGEKIILLPDGKVVRYQQGETGFNFTWDNLPCFFTETIE